MKIIMAMYIDRDPEIIGQVKLIDDEVDFINAWLSHLTPGRSIPEAFKVYTFRRGAHYPEPFDTFRYVNQKSETQWGGMVHRS